MEDGQGVAQSHLVAVSQPVRDGQPVTVDIGAVRRPEVLEPDAVQAPAHTGVAPAYSRIGKRDVGRGVSAQHLVKAGRDVDHQVGVGPIARDNVQRSYLCRHSPQASRSESLQRAQAKSVVPHLAEARVRRWDWPTGQFSVGRFESPAIWAGFVADAAPWRDGPGPRLIGALESRARKCPRFGAGRPATREVWTKPRPIGRVEDQASHSTADPAPTVAKSRRSFRPSRCKPQGVDRDRPDPAGQGGNPRLHRRPRAASPHCRPLAGTDGSATLTRPCVGPGQCRRPPSAPAQASAGTGARRRSRTAAGTTPANEIMAVTHQAWRKASR